MQRLPAVTSALVALFAVLIGASMLTLSPAGALPPAGTDLFNVTAQVDVESRYGFETVGLTGTIELQRGEPYLDGGTEVAAIELVGLTLTGNSVIGPLSVTESQTKTSMGELRSLQPEAQFPASSYIDAYIVAVIPANPAPTLALHNEQPLRLRPGAGGAETALNAWPPTGVTYSLRPVFAFDNDGDTLIDEDTPDEDGDGLYDEDRPGPDPDTPGSGFECRDNADCDNAEGEDPPANLCPPASPGTPTQCDPDGDGLIDEDPRCIPLLNPGNTHLKAGVCVRDVHIMIMSATTPTPSPASPQTPTASATATPSGEPPTPTETPATSVTPSPAPSATPTDEAPTATPPSTVTLSPSPSATPTPTFTPIGLLGDVNCSGAVTAVDAALVLQLEAGLVEVLGCEQLADVDADGVTNAVDAALIVQFVARLVSSLPPQPAS